MTSKIFSIVDLLKLKRYSGIILSPDKKYFLFSKRIWNQETTKKSTNLQFIAISNPQEIRDFTIPIEGQSDLSPSFVELSNKTFVLFNRIGQNGSQIFYKEFIPEEELNTQNEKQLTNYPLDISNLVVNNNLFVFSTDVYVKFDTMEQTAEENKKVSNRGKNSYQEFTKLMVRHWDIWYTEGMASHLFYQHFEYNNEENKLKLVENSPTDILKGLNISSPPFEEGTEHIDISSDNNFIVFTTNKKDNDEPFDTAWKIYLYNIKEKKLTNISEKFIGRTLYPKFSNDGKKIGFFALPRKGLELDESNLVIYNINENSYLYPENQHNFLPYIKNFNWCDDSSVFYSVIERGVGRLYRYDFINNKYYPLTDGNLIKSYGLPKKIENNKYFIFTTSFITNGEISLFTLDDPTKIITNIQFDFFSPNKKFLSNFNLLDPEIFIYKSSNGDDVQGFIFKPVNFDANKKYPLAFMIHGGPESAWNPNWHYRWNPQIYSNAGYVAVLINPHGSVGMGIEFTDKVRNDWGGLPYQDLMDGVKYVLEKYSFIDKDKMGALGGSYGGYMVNWIQGNTDIFKCLVCHSGVFNNINMYYGTEELWFPIAEFSPIGEEFKPPYDSEERKKLYLKHSPHTLVNNWKTPELVIHGGNDYRIPLTEGLCTFTALQSKGVESKFLYFPEETHFVAKEENSIKWHNEVIGWLDKYLK